MRTTMSVASEGGGGEARSSPWVPRRYILRPPLEVVAVRGTAVYRNGMAPRDCPRSLRCWLLPSPALRRRALPSVLLISQHHFLAPFRSCSPFPMRARILMPLRVRGPRSRPASPSLACERPNSALLDPRYINPTFPCGVFDKVYTAVEDLPPCFFDRLIFPRPPPLLRFEASPIPRSRPHCSSLQRLSGFPRTRNTRNAWCLYLHAAQH